MLKKLGKWLTKLFPNHTLQITLKPVVMDSPKKDAKAAEPADMKRWRLLQDHEAELKQAADKLAYDRAYYERNKAEIKKKRQLRYQAEKEASGRVTRPYSRRNLGVSVKTDGRQAYNKAWWAQAKSTGTTTTTFNRTNA